MSFEPPRGAVGPGDTMPHFSLQGFDPAAQGPRQFSLDGLIATGPLVLFFYPQADTPG